MQKARVILENAQFALTIERLCCQLVEEYDEFNNTYFVGVQTGGVNLAVRLNSFLANNLNLPNIQLGKLDITFYRDDFRSRNKPLVASSMEMDFLVEGTRVILVDDVLYTGRSIQAALTALNHYGRPQSVELLVLVDRRFNRNVPIQPDYTGIIVDTLDEAYVQVDWKESEGTDRVTLFPQKK